MDFRSGENKRYIDQLKASHKEVPVKKPKKQKKVVTAIRDFLSRRWLLLAIGWAGFLFVSGITTVLTVIDFWKPKVVFGPSKRFKAGYPEEYQVGEVSTKWVPKEKTWLVRTKKGLYALLAECRHLGCTPRWEPDEKLFRCPCHGSNYNLEGDVVYGPAANPLWRVAVILAPDGQIIVDKSIKEDRPGIREKNRFILHV